MTAFQSRYAGDVLIDGRRRHDELGGPGDWRSDFAAKAYYTKLVSPRSLHRRQQ